MNRDLVPIKPAALRNLVERFRAGAKESHDAQMAALREKYIPEMTRPRFFGLRKPRYTNPSDEEVIQYVYDRDMWTLEADFIHTYLVSKMLASQLSKMADKAGDESVLVSAKSFNSLMIYN